MDKVKDILKIVQKYHFWLLCVVSIIIGFVGWMMATSALSAVYVANKGKIESAFNSVKNVQNGDKHPHSQWKEGVDKLTSEEREKVRKAWVLAYDEQKKLLEWPKELGEVFLKFVNEHPQDAEIPGPLREHYINTIKNEFPRLPGIVDAEAKPSGAAKPGSGAAPTSEKPREYTVVWDSASQQEAEALLEWQQTPPSAEIRLAQEDLWVYAALLNIIRNVNQGQPVPRIKRIATLQIGRPAAKEFEAGMAPNHIDHLQAGEAPPPGSGQPPAAAAPPPAAEAGPKPIDEGRYVDAEGKPLAGGGAELSQFKRMPVNLKVVMDQREITKLLVECANSPLPVEVRQLRINPGGKSTSSSSSSGQSGNQANAISKSEGETYDVPVELNGIIYIFNRPDASQLGGNAADAANPGSAPAGGPPPAGAAAPG